MWPPARRRRVCRPSFSGSPSKLIRSACALPYFALNPPWPLAHRPLQISIHLLFEVRIDPRRCRKAQRLSEDRETRFPRRFRRHRTPSPRRPPPPPRLVCLPRRRPELSLPSVAAGLPSFNVAHFHKVCRRCSSSLEPFSLTSLSHPGFTRSTVHRHRRHLHNRVIFTRSLRCTIRTFGTSD